MTTTDAPPRGLRRVGRMLGRITESAWTIPVVVLLGVGGPRLWMNVRPADPLPPGWVEYSPERFDAMLADGGPLVVHVYATWCPTCLAQYRTLDALAREPDLAPVRGMRVNFDRDHDFRERFGVRTQSVILTFANSRELSRVVAVTRPDAIRPHLEAALAAVRNP